MISVIETDARPWRQRQERRRSEREREREGIRTPSDLCRRSAAGAHVCPIGHLAVHCIEPADPSLVLALRRPSRRFLVIDWTRCINYAASSPPRFVETILHFSEDSLFGGGGGIIWGENNRSLHWDVICMP